MQLPDGKPDREAIRGLIERQATQLQGLAVGSKRARQVQSEQSQELDTIAKTLSLEDQVAFHRVLLQELQAYHTRTRAEAAERERSADAAIEKWSQIFAVAFVLVVGFIVYLMTR